MPLDWFYFSRLALFCLHLLPKTKIFVVISSNVIGLMFKLNYLDVDVWAFILIVFLLILISQSISEGWCTIFFIHRNHNQKKTLLCISLENSSLNFICSGVFPTFFCCLLPIYCTLFIFKIYCSDFYLFDLRAFINDVMLVRRVMYLCNTMFEDVIKHQ